MGMDIESLADSPKSLSVPAILTARIAGLNDVHIRPLTEFVMQIRKDTGYGISIPFFDPMDGGINAKCLFLGEAPGPQAVKTGFISRNNPDNSAKNFWELNRDAGIQRKLTIAWNIVPWYIGSGKKIRPATSEDIRQGESVLLKLLPLLPKLIVVVLSGKKAQMGEEMILKRLPHVEIVAMMHTSPLVINTKPENRVKILDRLKYVAEILA